MIPFIYSKPSSYNDNWSYSFWMKVSSLPDNEVHIIHRGNKGEIPNRSPGVYFRVKPTTVINAKLFMTTIIPNRGAWLELESEKHDTIFANVNKRSRPINNFFRFFEKLSVTLILVFVVQSSIIYRQ